MDDELTLEVDGNVAMFTLNRPERRNAFTDEIILRWTEQLEECRLSPDIAVIVFAARGDSFCAGADTSRLGGAGALTPVASRDRMTSVAHAFVRKVASIDKPIIAAVNGAAVGGGMDLALMCDIRIASESARFAETYAKMGLLPGVGGAWFLPRIVGTSVALDLLWSGRWVDAAEAKMLGLVTEVVADADLAAHVKNYAEKLARSAPLSVRAIKKLAYQGQTITLDTHLDTLASQLAVVRTSEDHAEALAALKEKRMPDFKGR